MSFRLILPVLFLSALISCADAQDYPEPQHVKFERIDSLINASIADGAFPAAAIAIGNQDGIKKVAGYGTFTYEISRQIADSSIFDLASMSKVIGTTSAVMKLYEEGKLNLDAPIASYIPEFGQNGKDKVTIRQALTHSAGLEPFYPFYKMDIFTRDEILDYIFADSLKYEPGTDMRYSDLGLIMTALVVEKIAGQSLGEYLSNNFFEPMGMKNTGYRGVRGAGESEDIVPTEIDNIYRKKLVQGEVHDENAWTLGGMAGHAGLFSTAEDLGLFAQMYLNNGTLNGRQYLKPETIQLFITKVNPTQNTRAIGWDTKSAEGYSSAGPLFSAQSFGHTGYTGTSIWIDPENNVFAILLTNRVHPTRENRKISAVRPKFGELAFQAITNLD